MRTAISVKRGSQSSFSAPSSSCRLLPSSTSLVDPLLHSNSPLNHPYTTHYLWYVSLFTSPHHILATHPTRLDKSSPVSLSRENSPCSPASSRHSTATASVLPTTSLRQHVSTRLASYLVSVEWRAGSGQRDDKLDCLDELLCWLFAVNVSSRSARPSSSSYPCTFPVF